MPVQKQSLLPRLFFGQFLLYIHLLERNIRATGFREIDQFCFLTYRKIELRNQYTQKLRLLQQQF